MALLSKMFFFSVGDIPILLSAVSKIVIFFAIPVLFVCKLTGQSEPQKQRELPNDDIHRVTTASTHLASGTKLKDSNPALADVFS